MTSQTRYKLGKAWKEGRAKGDYQEYYEEFKDQIDKELSPKEEAKVEEVTKSKGKN